MEENISQNIETDFANLELKSTIGFQGKIKNGLIFHPDMNHIIYGIGQTIVIKNIITNKEYNLHGHTQNVTCIDLSKNGDFIASGQKNFMGFSANVIIWDFGLKLKYGSYSNHKVKVESVAFTCNGDFLLSLGGQDCKSVIVWNIKKKECLCGSPSATFIGGSPTIVKCANLNNFAFICAGNETLRLWRLNILTKKINATSIAIGQLKRDYLCLEIDSNDEYLYCGTSSGDVLKISLNLNTEDESRSQPKLLCVIRRVVLKKRNPSPLFSLGVTVIKLLRCGDLLIGTGEGLVSRCRQKVYFESKQVNKSSGTAFMQQKSSEERKPEVRFMEVSQIKVLDAVQAITLRGEGHQFYVGTTNCEIYCISLIEFRCELLYTCHGSRIYNISFPVNCSDIFATCAKESIRLWNLLNSKEILRISVPNMICFSVCFSADGRFVISGWNDGKIRAYTPETGKFIYSIVDSHRSGVTAIAGTSDSLRVLSGGSDGEIRVWEVNTYVQVLIKTMKEHKGSITSIKIKSDDSECLTSSEDGSCIIWDLKRYVQLRVVFANSLFKGVCYGPEECQILTCGTDHKICYWEVFDGIQIREVDGSLSSPINALAVSTDCKLFVTGGGDKILKVWDYQKGIVTHVGLGHSDEITAVSVAPNMKFIINVTGDGSIYIWHYPKPINAK